MKGYNLSSLVKYVMLITIFPTLLCAQKPTPVQREAELNILERNYGDAKYDPDAVSMGRAKKLAKKAFKLGDYYSSIDYLARYCEENPENWKYAWMLAESYRKARDYKNAEDWYARVAANKPGKYPKSSFYQALMQKSNGFYEEAPSLLNAFRKEYDKSDARIYKKLVKSEAAGAEMAKSLIDNPVKVAITRLDNNINRETMESSPIIINRDYIAYGSLIADVEEYYSLAGEDRPERKLYLAHRVKGNNWEKVGELPGPFNTEGFNVNSGAYSYDGARFYFTLCPKRIKNKNKCAIYVSNFKDGEWQFPEKLNEVINDPSYNSTQPAVGFAIDKKSKKKVDVLYFVSDREDRNRGGYDLYYSEFDPRINDFKKVKNLGSKVNSPGDEITPFYDTETGTLYFSSNGFPNLGGFDIFKSEGNPKDKFLPPVNIGFPLNSPADDLFYTLTKEHDEGFFVSNRIGTNSTINETCCDDIFTFIFTDFIKIGIKGVVFEMESPNDLPNATNLLEDVTVSLLARDVAGADTAMLQEVFPAAGEEYYFTLQHGKTYLLKAEADNYEPRYIPISTKKIAYSDTLIQDIGLKKIPPIEFEVPTIYFATNKATISKEQQEDLKSGLIPFLRMHPDLKLRIVGNSDDVGSSKYNDKLSERRATAVYKFLVGEDLEKERFEVVGVGESKPAVNPKTGEIPTEVAREKNRRVEFEVMDNPRYLIKVK
ncbi:OmpA family protein [Luteibaculum oceani]|uniref:OmpA family protein n=1 Tax=Luteibaculum oceani TaxID=1294296 RepID=A0A5C6VFB2_9FLAO|nr:OmpA family protein [Luteibaculum oceani]TXC81958.1 OmpA family protein [Luteibaculum oceani]